MKEMERRRGQGMVPPPATVGLKDPAEWVKHTQAMAGPAMLFCTLVEKDPRDGKVWANESLQRMAYEWRELLKTGGLEASVYDISDATAKRMLVGVRPPAHPPAGHPPRARACVHARASSRAYRDPRRSFAPHCDLSFRRPQVTMQSGWNAYELRDFLLQRPELEELEWDQVKYHPEDLAQIQANVGAPISDPLAGFRAQQEREAMLRKAGIDPDTVPAPPPPTPTPTPAPKKRKAKAKPSAKAKAAAGEL